jgi:hypothetical protein
MGEGDGLFERAEAAWARRQARARRWAVLARVVAGPVLSGLALVGLLAWWLSGWNAWPLTGAAGALAVLALLRVPRRAGPVWTAALALAVADAWWLTLVTPWWWAVLAGTILAAAAAAAAIATRLRTRRREILAALALGIVLLAGGIVGLAVTAAAERAEAQRQLQAAHDQAVPRIRPRGAGAMVFALTEQLAYISLAQHGNPTHAPIPGEQDAVATFCFNFSDTAQHQLAAALRVPDCAAAAETLARQVTGLAYTNNVSLPGSATVQSPDGLRVDACRLDFGTVFGDSGTVGPPGPQLGRLVLQQQSGEGHLVVSYAPCSGPR